jgi:hypothetical protein
VLQEDRRIGDTQRDRDRMRRCRDRAQLDYPCPAASDGCAQQVDLMAHGGRARVRHHTLFGNGACSAP